MDNMEELEKEHEPLMGFYFSCPHCQQKYVSAECVQEHSTNCHMQPSFMIPKIQSYSSLNPQALDLNFDSEGFQIRHEIIKIEPQDFIEDDNTDWLDKTEDPTVSNPTDTPEAQDDTLNPWTLRPPLTQQKSKIHYDSDETEDCNSSQNLPNVRKDRPFPYILRTSIKNPHSTGTEDRYLCRYCPRTFKYRCSVYAHEGRHARVPKYSCPPFRSSGNLVQHMKLHEPDAGFPCRYPGCPRTFKSPFIRWTHHKTHPGGRWRERGTWTRKLKQNLKSNTSPATFIPKSENFTGSDSMKKIKTERSIEDSSMTNLEDKASKNAQPTCSADLMRSHDPAQTVQCCYPGCPKTFKSNFKRWIHHKTHPKGRWNASGMMLGWSLQQNKITSMSPLKLNSDNESFTDKESMETSSTPDLRIEGPMTHLQTTSTNNLELENDPQSGVMNDATILESRDLSIPPPSRRRGRPVQPGDEIEIVTESGRKFKCDLCDKMFLSRMVARDHRLSHFEKPQSSCCMTGCSQKFFSTSQRVNHFKSIHCVRFPKGRPFLGSKRLALKITGPRKVIKKEIIPNVNTARHPSQSPQKIKLKKAIETSSKQLYENSDDEKGNTVTDSRPDFPFVRVDGKNYFWCDFPDCAIVTTNLETRFLHYKKHQVNSKQAEIAENSVGTDPKKLKVEQKEPQQLQMKLPETPVRNEDEFLGEALSSKPEKPEFSMQNDEEVPAQAPTQVLIVVLDQDFEADDDQEMSFDLLNQSMDTLQFIVPDDDSPMEHISLLNGDFNAENIVLTDSGLGSELSTEATSSSFNAALRNIPIDKVVQRPPLVKKRKSGGRRTLYPAIQIGSRELFCCNFPGCTGVFNQRKTVYLHAKRHRKGKKVNSQLKLTEDGRVFDSVGGCYLTE